jgi:hypothetical protein
MIDYAQILSTNYVGSQWSIFGNDYSSLQWFSNTQKPTQAELDAQWNSTQETIAKASCKQQASELLYATDWTTIPDVADPVNNPYLMNQADFIAYRNQVRQLAVNPVVNPVFPTKPTEQWSS